MQVKKIILLIPLLTVLSSTCSTQEDQSRHNWKLVNWDIKNQIKQTTAIFIKYKWVLVALLWFWCCCHVDFKILCLFLAVLWASLWSVITFYGHAHLCFLSFFACMRLYVLVWQCFMSRFTVLWWSCYWFCQFIASFIFLKSMLCFRRMEKAIINSECWADL